MYLSSIQILNYKSFRDSGEVSLSPGFNVVVGKNNSGKTAFLEAALLAFENIQHKSDVTKADGISTVILGFTLTIDELDNYLTHSQFAYPAHYAKSNYDVKEEFNQIIHDGVVNFRVEYTYLGEFRKAWIEGLHEVLSSNYLYLKLDTNSRRVELVNPNSGFSTLEQLMAKLRPQTYRFKADRTNSSVSEVGHSLELRTDASNLAEVLLNLASSKPAKFKAYLAHVQNLLPEIREIITQIKPSKSVEIYLAMSNEENQMLFSEIALAASGTGIAQILAILYVSVTKSEENITILIDEPQSFLHPGLLRDLLFTLQTEFPNHQYIIATHSSIPLATLDPVNIILIQKKGVESTARIIIADDSKNEFGILLNDLGVKYSDIFGVDAILWVEGQTEQDCFPLIIKASNYKAKLNKIAIKVMPSTDALSDRNYRRQDHIFDIYRKLSSGNNLDLPVRFRFLLDSESRSDQQKKDINARASNSVDFLPRRTYENYLLDPDAIAVVMNSQGEKIEVEDVRNWINQNGSDSKYLNPHSFQSEQEIQITENMEWLQKVHGAELLKALFRELSETRLKYEKVEYGKDLTDWLLQNKPDALAELQDFLKSVLDKLIPSK